MPRLRDERPAERRDVSALLGELQGLAPRAGSAGSRSSRAIAALASSSAARRLEVLAADLARNVERLADPALVVLEVAEPPADPGAHRSASKRSSGAPSSSSASACSTSSRPRGRSASRSSATSESATSASPWSRVSPASRPRRTALHLGCHRRQVGEPPRRTRGEVAALERRVELDRAKQQPPRRAVRLACKRAPAGLLERARPRAARAPPGRPRRAPRAAAPPGRGGRRESR